MAHGQPEGRRAMRKILIVDDNPVDQAFAEKCIADQGYQVIKAADGRAAQELIAAASPDVVLTDMQMPDIDGLELVREIRRSHTHIPVVIMTAFGSEEMATQALNAGAASYVPKRLLKDQIGDVLRTVLQAVESAQERQLVGELVSEISMVFRMGYQPKATQALINYFQDVLKRVRFGDQTLIFQITVAVTEALTNAIEHGNLGLKSTLRESGAYQELGDERKQMSPYRNRVATVHFDLNAEHVQFVIQDQGDGFDTSSLPDPTDPENLMKDSGRGLTLIRTFMDEVKYNEEGTKISMRKLRPAPLID